METPYLVNISFLSLLHQSLLTKRYGFSFTGKILRRHYIGLPSLGKNINVGLIEVLPELFVSY